MPSVVLLREGTRGAVTRDALIQEGIGFVEIRPEDLGALGEGVYRNARVLILPAPLDGAGLAHLTRWRARGGATLLLGSDWPAELLLELGVRELPHVVSGGHLWASSADLVLPALAPDRPLQITGERRLHAVKANDTTTLALASAHPSAVVALDANRDGFADDEWYFCGPSISRLSRGRPAAEPLALPGLGEFAARAAAAGDFTGDGFADDLLVASGETFALRRGGLWAEPRRAPARIRHALSHPGPGALWALHLFLGDGATYISSFDGGATFGPRSAFAPGGTPIASDFSYSFDFIDAGGARRAGLHVWSGDSFHANLGLGFEPVPSIADFGPRYLGVNTVRPSLGFCSDADHRGLRDRLTLVVGDNLYRLDPATGSFDYPRALHRQLDVAKTPLVVRRDKTIAFLFDFEDAVKSLQQGRAERVPKRLPRSGLPAGGAPRGGPELAPVISAFDDWIDYTAWDLPQADLHERLLRQAIVGLLNEPLPRLWYWPGAARSIASLSHDVETAVPGEPDEVRSCTLEIARRCAAAGRRDTFFVLDTPGESVLRSEDIAAIEQLGHHATVHFDTFGFADFSPANLRAQAARLRALGVAKVTGNRTHALAWSGDRVPRALASEPEIFFDSTFGGGPGFSHCGSALPYRLYDAHGEPFESFEEISHALMDVADAKLYFSGIAPGLLPLTVEELFERARSLARRNHEAFHGVLDCSFHPAVVAGLVPPIAPFLEALSAHAEFLSKEGIPSLTLEQVAAWWRLRRGLAIVDVTMSSDGRLEFALEAREPVASPTIVLPVHWAGRSLAKISAARKALAWTPQLIDGAQVAMVVLPESRGRIEIAATYRP
jgi:hypothetical protein